MSRTRPLDDSYLKQLLSRSSWTSRVRVLARSGEKLHEKRNVIQIDVAIVVQSGLVGNTYELHSALLRALDTPDVAERWARGEDVFAGCKVPVECLGSGLSLPVLRQ